MLTLLSLIGLIVALAVGIGLWMRAHNAAAQQRIAQTRIDCEQFIELVRLLQQHRGMSSAKLGGDTSFDAAIKERRRQILLCLGHINTTVKAEADMPRPCLTHQDLALFRHRWTELLEKLEMLNIEQSITQHTQLIGRVLDWLAALGEARIELPSRGRLAPDIVRNYTNHLPALTECLGQIRALGSGAAAQGSCSPVARVRLMFLVTRATTLISQATGAHPEGVTQVARDAVDRLLTTVRREVLTGGEVHISAEAYFTLATEALESVFAWIRDCGQRISEQLLQTEAGAEA